jgi:rhodanese-related sulfurtransferase
MVKKIILGSLIVVGLTIVIALAGIYKFGYLSDKKGYDVDGNKIVQPVESAEKIRKKQVAVENKNLKQKQAMSDGHHLISPAEFKKKIETDEYVLVDIRTAKEYTNEHILGADLNLDFYADDFAEQVNKLDKDKKYLYYCRTGHRSGQAGHYAEQFGFKNVYELEGGISAWKKAGYEIVANNKL